MRISGAIIGGLALIAPMSAHASGTTVDLSTVTKVACSGIVDEKLERSVPLSRIAEAILIAAGFPPSSLIGDQAVTRDQYRVLVLQTLLTPPSQMDAETKRLVGQYVLKLGQDIGPSSRISAKALGLRLTSPVPAPTSGDRYWLFESATSAEIVCMPTDPTPGIVAQTQAPTTLPRIGLVNKIDDLGLEGDDRRSADSATIGVKRSRTREDDGTRKIDTTLTFDGTLGLRLSGDHASTPTFVFANYTLSRERTQPAPTLDPGKSIDGGDTNGLEIGLAFHQLPLFRDWMLSGQTGYVLDFVKESRRAVGELSLVPPFQITDVGICWFGGLKGISVAGAKFRTRCTLSIEGAYSHVFRAGSAQFNDDGNFLSAGFSVGLEFVPPLHAKSGIAANIGYRYLPTISGRAPDVIPTCGEADSRRGFPNC